MIPRWVDGWQPNLAHAFWSFLSFFWGVEIVANKNTTLIGRIAAVSTISGNTYQSVLYCDHNTSFCATHLEEESSIFFSFYQLG